MTKDERWMQIALLEAKKAEHANEVPVGAIIVKGENLISQAHNQPISKNDPTAHAEIQVLRKAGQKLKNYRLTGTTLYVTLEPCAMCLAAMLHARIERVVFGAYDHKTGYSSSFLNSNYTKNLNHEIQIYGGILEDLCSKLLIKFFKNRR